MKTLTLPLSLLIGAALTIPSLAMAEPVGTAADMQTASTVDTLETEVGNADSESAPDQSSPFQVSETQTFSRASINNTADQQQMTNEPEIQQEDMQDPQEAMLQEEALLDAEEDLQPASQENVEAL